MTAAINNDIRALLVADITKHNQEKKLIASLELAMEMKNAQLFQYCNNAEERARVPIPDIAPSRPYDALVELEMMVRILNTNLIYTGNLPSDYIRWERGHYYPAERSTPIGPRMDRFIASLENDE